MSDSLEAGKPVSPKLEGLEGDIASSGNFILGLSFLYIKWMLNLVIGSLFHVFISCFRGTLVFSIFEPRF